MFRPVSIAFAALLLTGCGPETPDAPMPPATEPGLTAFINASVWDGSGDALIPDAVMVVRSGRIETLGAEPPPAGAVIVDLGGRFVIPGIVNTHGHVSGRWADAGIDDAAERVVAELTLLARYGVTTVNSLGGEPPEAIAVRDAQQDPALQRARLYVAGPVISDADPAAARSSAEANAALGVDWLKLRVDDNLGRSEKMPWEAVQAVFDVATETGLQVATHVFYLDDASRLLDMNSGLIAHSVRDRPVTAEFIEQIRDRGICYVPTLTREVSTFVYADRPAFFDDPFFLLHADREEMARVSAPGFMAAMAGSETAAGYRAAWVQAMENLKELSDAGVRIAFGTDSGPPARFPGYFEHLELEMMVLAGMSPEAALTGATRVAAECLGRDDIGTLEAGKWADFLVLEENPLADIDATKSLVRTYVAGNPIPL